MVEVGKISDYIDIDEYKRKYPHTSFPESMDDEKKHGTMTDITTDMLPQLKRYNEQFSVNPDYAYKTACEEIGNTGFRLTDALFNAEKFNWLRDSMLATQRFVMTSLDEMVKNVIQKSQNFITSETDNKDPEISVYNVSTINSIMFSTHKAALLKDRWVKNNTTGMFSQTAECDGVFKKYDYMKYPLLNMAFDPKQEGTENKGFVYKAFSIPETKVYLKAFGRLVDGSVDKDNQVTFTAMAKPEVDFCLYLKRI